MKNKLYNVGIIKKEEHKAGIISPNEKLKSNRIIRKSIDLVYSIII